jgi:hypothetical protein
MQLAADGLRAAEQNAGAKKDTLVG